VRRDARLHERVQEFRIRKDPSIRFTLDGIAAGVAMGVAWSRIKNSSIEVVHKGVEGAEDGSGYA
jgi:hypothetical protein